MKLDRLASERGLHRGGHVGADIITLCSMLRIPVLMHNVPADKIYLPHPWSAFGSIDTEAADYSACEKYSPIYG